MIRTKCIEIIDKFGDIHLINPDKICHVEESNNINTINITYQNSHKVILFEVDNERKLALHDLKVGIRNRV